MKLYRYLISFMLMLTIVSCSGIEEDTTGETKSTQQETTDVPTLQEKTIYLNYSESHIEEIETFIGDVVFLPVLSHELIYHYVFSGWSDGEETYLGYTEVTEDMENLEPVFNTVRSQFEFYSIGIEGKYIGESTNLVVPGFYGAWNQFSNGFMLEDRTDIKKLFIPDTITQMPDLSHLENLEQVIFYQVERKNVLIGSAPYIQNDYTVEIDGLKLPLGFFPHQVIDGSLTNQWVDCEDSSTYCVDGLVQFNKEDKDKSIGIYASKYDENIESFIPMSFSYIWMPDEVILNVKIDSSNSWNNSLLDKDSSLKVYFEEIIDVEDNKMHLLMDSSDPTTYDSYADGLFTVDIANHPDLLYDTTEYQLLIVYESNELDAFVMEYMSLSAKTGDTYFGDYQVEGDTYLLYARDYELLSFVEARYILDEFGEQLYFVDSEMIGGQQFTASFVLDGYEVAYGKRLRENYPRSELQEKLQNCTYEDGSEINFEYLKSGKFDDNCPIIELIRKENNGYYSNDIWYNQLLHDDLEVIDFDSLDYLENVEYVILPDYANKED